MLLYADTILTIAMASWLFSRLPITIKATKYDSSVPLTKKNRLHYTLETRYVILYLTRQITSIIDSAILLHKLLQNAYFSSSLYIVTPELLSNWKNLFSTTITYIIPTFIKKNLCFCIYHCDV